MTEATVFAAPATTVVAPVVSTTTLPPEVIEFVGVGKKYATEVDALKSIPHAQKHITTLEAELLAANEELTKRKTTEELLEQIKASGTQQVTTTTPAAVTTEQMTQLINQNLTEREAQVKAQININQVTSVFTEKFGAKAEETFINIAKEMGLTVANLNKLAATSPSAVLKLAGIEDKRSSVTTKPTSTVNTETFKPNSGGDILTAKVTGGSTKDLVSAWKVAGQKIGKQTT